VSQELGGGDHDHPSWSPDGSQIAFEANNGVYVVPSTGGVPKVLVDSTHGVVLSPAWSADGSLIAYADSRGIHTRAVSGLGGSGALSESTVADGNDLHSIAWSEDRVCERQSSRAQQPVGRAGSRRQHSKPRDIASRAAGVDQCQSHMVSGWFVVAVCVEPRRSIGRV
jgi:dipeptidyl aminopeptidase/acylaminoacyl peptidase